MTQGSAVWTQDRSPAADVSLHEYFCPVCGAELSLSNFETPEREYYCPYCATRQTPAIL
jgi:DNA-directed RNA polymerase subunit RPC12/RpoP